MKKTILCGLIIILAVAMNLPAQRGPGGGGGGGGAGGGGRPGGGGPGGGPGGGGPGGGGAGGPGGGRPFQPPQPPQPPQPQPPAATIPSSVTDQRKETVLDKQRSDVTYKFDKDFQSLTERAALRGKIAADAWAKADKSLTPVAVIAHNPWGGGETADTYWPKEVDPKLLPTIGPALVKAGVRAVFPDFPDAATSQPTTSYATMEEALAAQAAADAAVKNGGDKPKPVPAAGFPDEKDYQFVLLVGMHHELNPHGGKRQADDGKTIYFRRSRVGAFAILFHVPTATAFWATVGSGQADYVGVADPPTTAAKEALGNLDLTDIGKDNLQVVAELMGSSSELAGVDYAACLCQTERADAVAAVVKICKSDKALKQTAPVLRYFNEKGTAQDYRIDKADAESKGFALIDQRVSMHLLLLEQLRGVRSFEGAMVMATTPMVEDYDIKPLGKTLVTTAAPWNSDEELELITELAVEDGRDPAKTVFDKNWPGAIQNLGKCKFRVDDAIGVAKYYVNRRPPAMRPGQPPHQDPLRGPAQAALDELNKAKAPKGTGPGPAPAPQPANPNPAKPPDKTTPAPTPDGENPWRNLVPN